ncbi:MAG: SHOCT domain-containing protein [Thaumarchaeota archaeon]|nr:SHOCT domain-containing protein [Nitrososphaerota archaeon]MBI3641616.1 SHOCT domain-containing protein [Nitrososphaerota archaeon]
MRINLVVIGLLLVLIAIPGYLDTPNLISQMVHSMMGPVTGSIPGTNSGAILHQMGYPSRSTIIPLIQYSFVGLAVAGLGFVAFGAVAKKIPKQFTVKLVTEEPEKVKEFHSDTQPTDERTQTNLRSLRILQERLAKGEITSSEFQNLKRFLE